MGLFKEKPPKEKNEINNKTLKENIANIALAQYRVIIKAITDKDTFYFAVQGTKLLRLSLSEELFNAYVDGFWKVTMLNRNFGFCF